MILQKGAHVLRSRLTFFSLKPVQLFRAVHTQVLKEDQIKNSMDGKGRWIDNVMIERLWQSVKYECVYVVALRLGLG
jgi:hypothetical protein